MGVNAGGVVSLEDRPTPSTLTRTVSREDVAAGGFAPVGTVELMFSNAFAFDESAAYVVRGGDGDSDVVRLDLASSEVSSLADARREETLRALAVSGGVVYFASTTRIGRIQGGGGAAGASTLVDTPAYRLVADSEYVYFFTATCAGAEPPLGHKSQTPTPFWRPAFAATRTAPFSCSWPASERRRCWLGASFPSAPCAARCTSG
jgi:hypothetical protein